MQRQAPVSLPRSARRKARGFTLIEAMVVVAIVGILAALAVFGVRQYIFTSKTSEATQMLRDIKAAQETYKADTFVYLNVSDISSLSNFYPSTTPGSKKTAWGAAGPSLVAWDTLNVRPSAPLTYTYACSAGSGTTVPSSPGFTVANWPSAATGQVWFVAKAMGNLNNDGVYSSFVSPSFTDQVFVDNELE